MALAPEKPWFDEIAGSVYRQTIAVEGMDCVHCTASVTQELAAANPPVYTLGAKLCKEAGVSWGELEVVSADPFDEASQAEMTRAIDEAGYQGVTYGI